MILAVLFMKFPEGKLLLFELQVHLPSEQKIKGPPVGEPFVFVPLVEKQYFRPLFEKKHRIHAAFCIFKTVCNKKDTLCPYPKKVGNEQTAVKSLRFQRLRQCERDFFRKGAATRKVSRRFFA